MFARRTSIAAVLTSCFLAFASTSANGAVDRMFDSGLMEDYQPVSMLVIINVILILQDVLLKVILVLMMVNVIPFQRIVLVKTAQVSRVLAVSMVMSVTKQEVVNVKMGLRCVLMVLVGLNQNVPGSKNVMGVLILFVILQKVVHVQQGTGVWMGYAMIVKMNKGLVEVRLYVWMVFVSHVHCLKSTGPLAVQVVVKLCR